jgi:hypothetical protein
MLSLRNHRLTLQLQQAAAKQRVVAAPQAFLIPPRRIQLLTHFRTCWELHHLKVSFLPLK